MRAPKLSGKSEPDCAFGVPDQHFLRLALQALEALTEQSRERGYSHLTSALLTANREAQEALSAYEAGSHHLSDEARLMKLVEDIRSDINEVTQDTRSTPDEKPQAERNRLRA
jgi:hypothetical protein